jgi:putative SOS response-associated peptidase YedK
MLRLTDPNMGFDHSGADNDFMAKALAESGIFVASDVSEIKLVFRIPPDRPTPNFPPSWNVARTDSLPVVRYDAKAGQRSLNMLRWGLIPYWAKDMNVGFANINAKAECIENKPAFRKAF